MTEIGCCCENYVTPKEENLVGMNPRHRYGCHLPIAGKGLVDVLKVAAKTGCHCCQVFLGNPQRYQCREISDEEREAALKYCERNNMTYYVHINYVANLARRKDDPKGKAILKKSKKLVKESLKQIRGQPAACILHAGAKDTVESLAANLDELNVKRGKHHRMPAQLLIEPPAGAGTQICKSWKEIRKLYEALDSTNIGLCLDTAHMFTSEMCSFESHEKVVRMFEKAERYPLRVFHLNDSSAEYGSCKDRHACAGEGCIWCFKDFNKVSFTEETFDKDLKRVKKFFAEDGNGESLATLIDICREKGYDMISETPNPFQDFALVKLWDITK